MNLGGVRYFFIEVLRICGPWRFAEGSLSRLRRVAPEVRKHRTEVTEVFLTVDLSRVMRAVGSNPGWRLP
jgi:hypothetical protein